MAVEVECDSVEYLDCEKERRLDWKESSANLWAGVANDGWICCEPVRLRAKIDMI